MSANIGTGTDTDKEKTRVIYIIESYVEQRWGDKCILLECVPLYRIKAKRIPLSMYTVEGTRSIHETPDNFCVDCNNWILVKDGFESVDYCVLYIRTIRRYETDLKTEYYDENGYYLMSLVEDLYEKEENNVG